VDLRLRAARQAETTEVIAYHFEQALHYGDRDEDLERLSFDALVAAGDAAVRRGAYASAEGLLSRALEIAPTKPVRARALLLAARADVATRRYERAVARLDETIRITDRTGDANLRADALGWKARVSWLQGSWREALESAPAAVTTLEGLPESAELARALARLSQIEMLRALPAAESTAARAIEVAQRTGERAAEANARTNMLTVLGARRGMVPTKGELSEVIALALEAGAHDEAARAVVNYLWSAALIGPVGPAEIVVRDAVRNLGVGLAVEAYEQYLQLSLGALVYVPAGRWREADAVLAAGEVTMSASGRLVWLWLGTGLALRRGDLEVTDRYLPELRETALASEEPQRILPMACVAMPRALLAGERGTVEELADIVLALPAEGFASAFMLTIVRSLAAIEDRDRLEQLVRIFAGAISAAPQASLKVADGLLARLDGRTDEARGLLMEGADELDRLGRHYDAACVALEAAVAADASGEVEFASVTRTRAAALLDPLGCVNPF
jgi:tetratricopeptide (TPR) repeat protein